MLARSTRHHRGPSVELALTIGVLGVRENRTWCAIALDMSLRGYGQVFEEALDQLRRTVEAQISFAVQHDSVDQVFVPAEPHYFKLYADLKRETIRRRLLEREALDMPDYRVGDMLLPQPGGATFRRAMA